MGGWGRGEGMTVKRKEGLGGRDLPLGSGYAEAEAGDQREAGEAESRS